MLGFLGAATYRGAIRHGGRSENLFGRDCFLFFCSVHLREDILAKVKFAETNPAKYMRLKFSMACAMKRIPNLFLKVAHIVCGGPHLLLRTQSPWAHKVARHKHPACNAYDFLC